MHETRVRNILMPRDFIPDSASQKGRKRIKPIVNLLLVQCLKKISAIFCDDTERKKLFNKIEIFLESNLKKKERMPT
jgi:hypothetical protein